MLGRMTSTQMAEWTAYFNLDPWGEERADLRMGILASLIHNMAGRVSKGNKRAADFMPKFNTEPKRQTAKEMLNTLKAMAGKAKVKPEKKPHQGERT
jgi:hypothetical protein